MRFAHESQGGYTKHGRTGLKGLECDKMSAEAAIVQWKNYFKVIYDSLSVRGCPPSGMIMDSHEAGGAELDSRIRTRVYEAQRI